MADKVAQWDVTLLVRIVTYGLESQATQIRERVARELDLHFSQVTVEQLDVQEYVD